MTVGIVVVSHSRALADAAVALAAEMLHGREAPIEIAAGLDGGAFGTDAVAIQDAIGRADRGDGVVVLMDMGSAVLSAELALEFLDDDARGRVVLSAAPLVEGLIVAAVAADSGASAAEVAAEATEALAGKYSQLAPTESIEDALEGAAGGVPDAAQASPPAAAVAVGGQPGRSPRPASAEEVAAAAAGGAATGVFTVTMPHGLHARPAALVVQAVRRLDAEVALRNRTLGTGFVPAGSLSKVATLGALQGHELEVRANGAQAHDAVAALLDLARDGFG